MMRLVFLPANQSWAFVFGRDARTASVVAMDERALFTFRMDAIAAAKRKRLRVKRSGLVELA